MDPVWLLAWASNQGFTSSLRRKRCREVLLADTQIRALEAGRYRPTRTQWEALTAALPKLQAEVEREGIRVDPTAQNTA